MNHLSTLSGLAALLAALTVATATSLPAQSSDPARVAAAVDSIAAAALKDGHAAGMSVAVSLAGRPLVTKGYGYVDLEWKVPTPTGAIYEIGSVTKQFTAAAVMQLVEGGKIDLDADLTTYLPDYDTQGRRVPVRRLLDHTSGIASYTSLPEFRDFETRTFPRDSLVKVFSKKPFTFEPGALESYNNSGFFLLGLIIEKVSGTPYAEYVQRNLFDRAGLKSSRYCSTTEIVPAMAHGYDMGEKGLQRAGYIDFTWPYAAGSLCSTVADLDAWNQALHGGKVLGRGAYKEMTTPGTLNDGSRLRYAKGIAVSEIAGRRALHHGGDIPGFATYLAYFPDRRLSIAVTVNSEGPVRPDAIASSIAELVLGKATTPVASVEAGAAPEYVGSYGGVGGMGEDLTVKVVADSAGRLALEGGPLTRPSSPNTLARTGTDTFQLDDKQLTFVREKGRIVKLHVDAVYAHLVLARRP